MTTLWLLLTILLLMHLSVCSQRQGKRQRLATPPPASSSRLRAALAKIKELEAQLDAARQQPVATAGQLKARKITSKKRGKTPKQVQAQAPHQEHVQLEEGLKGLSNFERRMHGLDLAATARYAPTTSQKHGWKPVPEACDAQLSDGECACRDWADTVKQSSNSVSRRMHTGSDRRRRMPWDQQAVSTLNELAQELGTGSWKAILEGGWQRPSVVGSRCVLTAPNPRTPTDVLKQTC